MVRIKDSLNRIKTFLFIELHASFITFFGVGKMYLVDILFKYILIRFIPLFVLTIILSACVSVMVYEPMARIHNPTAIDLDRKNFKNTRVALKCDMPLDPRGRIVLCRKLLILLERQGASTYLLGEKEDNDFVIHVKSKSVELEKSNMLSRMIDFVFLSSGVLLLGVIPTEENSWYAVDISVYDGNNALLSQEKFKFLIKEYVGPMFQIYNSFMNILLRNEDELVDTEMSKKDFSKDFYTQVSQMIFNAKQKKLVLTGSQ